MRAAVNFEFGAGAVFGRRTAVLAFWLVALASPALALDGSDGAAPPAKISPSRTFSSAREALRTGVDELHAGDAKGSLQALTYAAEGGEPLAQWKLGSLYATGDMVPRDDVKAYKYFDEIVDNYDEDDYDRRDVAAISNAFVSVGVYCLTGISGSGVNPDPERAVQMFEMAATRFGDPEAEYRLARMFVDGAGGLDKDNMRAAKWLGLAAEKGHHGAQALLGHLLFRGDGVPRQTARGLMWLTIAHFTAKGPKDGWIHELQAKDYSAASPDDREAAAVYLSARGKHELATAMLAPSRSAVATAPPMRLPSAAPAQGLSKGD